MIEKRAKEAAAKALKWGKVNMMHSGAVILRWCAEQAALAEAAGNSWIMGGLMQAYATATGLRWDVVRWRASQACLTGHSTPAKVCRRACTFMYAEGLRDEN